MKSCSIALAFLAAGLLLASSTSVAQDVHVIEVTAKKYEFDPSPIHVKQGAKVQLKITASDHTHGFRIRSMPDGIDTHGQPGLIFTSSQECHRIEKGTTEVIEFVAQTPGTYPFSCCVVCGLHHHSMKSELIVDP